MDMTNLAGRIVDTVRSHGGDVEKFRDDVLGIAQDTARTVAVTVDYEVTDQLKAALLFLYGIADVATAALESAKGDAKSGAEEGFPMDL